MNYFKLVSTTPDVLEKIECAEREERFSDHLDPIDFSNCYPVDETFPYVPDGKLLRKQKLQNFFIIRPFTFFVNHFLFHTKVYGRENLGDIKNAVLTCNHVNKLDALAVKHGIRRHRLKIMVGDFNNQKGKLGDYMRAAGIMPFSKNSGAFQKFMRAVSFYLKNDTYVLFFPEQSEWWCYEKPRPMKEGAFHFAVKNKVPVIPTFITFRKTGKFDENGIEKRRFYLHIMPPIYPDAALSDKENMQQMLKKNEELCRAKYEEFYHII